MPNPKGKEKKLFLSYFNREGDGATAVRTQEEFLGTINARPIHIVIERGGTKPTRK